MYTLPGDAPVGESARQVLQERRWAAQIEVRLARHADLLEHRHAQVSSSVEVQPGLLLLTGPAVEDIAMTVGQSLKEARRLLCKGMLVAVT